MSSPTSVRRRRHLPLLARRSGRTHLIGGTALFLFRLVSIPHLVSTVCLALFLDRALVCGRYQREERRSRYISKSHTGGALTWLHAEAKHVDKPCLSHAAANQAATDLTGSGSGPDMVTWKSAAPRGHESSTPATATVKHRKPHTWRASAPRCLGNSWLRLGEPDVPVWPLACAGKSAPLTGVKG